MSQFDHFGISYDRADVTLGTLFRKMKDSDREGKFNSVPPSVTSIHKILRKKWDAGKTDSLKPPHEADTESYKMKLARWKLSTFNSKNTLAEKAAVDTELFLKTCYLDADCRPDRTKAPNFLMLEGVQSRLLSTRIWWIVPGLYTAQHCGETETGGNKWYFILGWDAAQVEHTRRKLIAESERWRVEHAQRAEQKRLEAHHQYLADPHRTKSFPSAPEQQKPSPLGRYLVRCPGFEDVWDGPLYLTIRPPKVLDPSLAGRAFEAVMDFPIIIGKIMMFDHKYLLETWLGSIRNPHGHARDNASRGIFSGQNKEGEDMETGLVRDKEHVVPLMYHFVWKGYDREGLIVGYNHRSYGRILFEDNSFTKFGGEMDFENGAISGNMKGKSLFGGGKVSNSLECDDRGLTSDEEELEEEAEEDSDPDADME